MEFTHPRARLPEGERVYAIGDIHGMGHLLADTFARIEDDLARHPAAAATEIYLGDYIDRGPDSAGVVAALDARRAARRLVLLLGNHERLMLDALTHAPSFSRWLKYGGRETLQSYGIAPPDSPADEARAQAALAGKIVGPTRDFFERLAPSHRAGDFLFVHAGIRPGVPLPMQDIMDLTFIRGEFLDSTVDHGVVVVHGHTPAEAIDIRPFRINIDTGACYGGALSCIAIEGGTIRRI